MISTGLLRSLEAVEAAYASGEIERGKEDAAVDKIPLVERVMGIIRGRITAMSLAPGARLPSIRRLAETMNVSKSTVVEAYDRLVAEGIIQSRRGAGFYVSERARQPFSLAAHTPHKERQIDPFWVMRQSLEANEATLKPGCGWLPDAWLPQDAIRRAMRMVARDETSNLATYGEPLGFRPMRQHLAHRLGEQGIDVSSGEILLADSGTQALDLICRYLLQPGDTVLVDDPCYFNFQAALLTHRVKIVGVPYTTTGPDLEAFASAANEHTPKLYISNAGLHNPTGGSMTPATAHRLLKLAEAHGITLVEDNIFGDFHPSPAPLLCRTRRVRSRSAYRQLLQDAVGGRPRRLYRRASRLDRRAHRPEARDKLRRQCNVTADRACTPDRRHLSPPCRQPARQAGRRHDADSQPPESRGPHALDRTTGRHVPLGKIAGWAGLRTGCPACSGKGVLLAPGDVFSPSRTAGAFLRFNVAQSLEPYVFAVLRDAMRDARSKADS